MPRSRRNQPEPEPAPDFPTDVEFDFTPPQSNVRPFPTLPNVQRSDRLNLPELEGLERIL